MSRLNAKETIFQKMEIRGISGIYVDARIARDTVPVNQNGEKLWLYELRDDCSDGIPCQYKYGIMVDFCGTFISKEPLPDKDNGFFEENEFVCASESITIDDYISL